MSEPDRNNERDLIRQWVETWRMAGPQLDAIRSREAESITVQEAVRQVFDGMESALPAPASNTSGLVEQQMWFSRIRARDRSRKDASEVSE